MDVKLITTSVPLKLLVLVGALIWILASGALAADIQQNAGTESEAQIIKKFTSQEDKESELIAISDKRKRQVMFAMGVPLLLFIIITVAFGISMGVFGKDVYVPHMIFAGLSLTLALAHAIVGLVWFWPF